MKVRGAQLVVKALEDEGVPCTFGIPGTHNIELYDALEDAPTLRPILVTDEQSASFMADGVSRSSPSLGVVNLVPGAGVTHALSGIAEAFMDNVPLLVLACGIRQDMGMAFQLHHIDQSALLRPITKEVIRPESAEDLYVAVRRACRLARSGCPGPVAVEVPADFYFVTQEVRQPYREPEETVPKAPDEKLVAEVAKRLNAAHRPLLYVGNGASGAVQELQRLAELLAAPVGTTIQGKGVFDERHPLWLWNGLGRAAPPFVQKIVAQADCILALGCRFGEVATASYGMDLPVAVIHVDVDPGVFHRNVPTDLAVEGDAGLFLKALLPKIRHRARDTALEQTIAEGHAEVQRRWASWSSPDRVTPHRFFAALQEHAGSQAVFVTDSGNGTFLAMEHLRLQGPGRFLAPVDFSCMGYSVPAAIGSALVHPDRPVVALAGDGALLMTGLELLTASHYGIGLVVCVLRDQKLGQIAQFQKVPMNRETCSQLPPYRVEDLARLTGSGFLHLEKDESLNRVLEEAFRQAHQGRPVLVDVAVDTSQKTYFTKGVLTTNFWRLSWPDRLRMLKRALARRLPKAG
ncbi:acetolactate synthase-1/2/3 large subunit [Desulfacinum hydrothermale DSM 13146]|uniref:Acetolactate synthase-1/2/3 large subunit n=1 Tax=Desulfacinum hydrothermale DSM 13146 TaxID=1121390 RepID=A0A1W1WXF2_9BACT|nr:thiamine pyrophosphate-binding protein [Desulfacinum hydrothermale]SMC16260.1 acetolactate synthase-1/2/3 large subunit [Desulfacinum hydrothermale DSM 13146]